MDCNSLECIHGSIYLLAFQRNDLAKRKSCYDWIWIDGNYVCSSLGTNVEVMIVCLLKVTVTEWNLLMAIISIMILLEYISNSDTRGILVTVQMVIMQALTIITISNDSVINGSKSGVYDRR
ncbi:MAG: hypothetical protein ACRC36_25070 [Lacrimispora sphenoides]